MSWNLSLSGHVDTGHGPEQDKATEEAVRERIREFVASLGPRPSSAGVTYASWSGQHTGSEQLVAPTP